MLTLLLTFLLSQSAWSQDLDSIRVWFDVTCAKSIKLESDLDYGNFDVQEEEDGKVRAVLVDLNEDGTPEVFIPTACGKGGCDYPVYDGRSRRFLGRVFGYLIFISQSKSNGMPVIFAYGNLSAGSGTLIRYEFDGREYKEASWRELRGESIDSLFAQLGKLPKLDPHTPTP